MSPSLKDHRYPQPQGGAALPLTFHPSTQTPVLVVGHGKLAASRAFTFLDSSARVIVASSDLAAACGELKFRAKNQQVEWQQAPSDAEEDEAAAWAAYLDKIDGLSLVAVTDTALTTSTHPGDRRSYASAKAIHQACRRLHIPINVADCPTLCTYTFPAVHRFPGNPSRTGKYLSNLQVAVSTNGRGCRLAGRIKRDIASRLPKGIGAAVDNVGLLRDRVHEEGRARGVHVGSERPSLKSRSCSRRRRDSSRSRFVLGEEEAPVKGEAVDDDDVAAYSAGPLNTPVVQLPSPALSRANSGFFASKPLSAIPSAESVVAHEQQEMAPVVLSPEEEQLRRMRWVSQISEYWSIEYLARMSSEEMDKALDMWTNERDGAAAPKDGGDADVSANGQGAALSGSGDREQSSVPGVNAHGGSAPSPYLPTTPRHEIALGLPPAAPVVRKGRILLLGSGPGHPSLLTVAAHQALMTSTLILSDKLVPSEILALIPSSITLHIAKKFPGNAEGAQNEMMALALEGAQRGEIVVRLKQGDPFVYGRGGEEILFFRQHGFEPVVVPGVSSALAGPLMMNIPVTQRGVAESMVLCTGVGRKGKAVQLPGYVRSRTLVVLMGVARIKQVLQVLLRPAEEAVTDPETQGWRDGAAFPPYLPIAIIERASSHDQRMVASTLDGIEDALERAGEQRPPGMMIIGWSVLALEGEGEVTVLDEDEESTGLEQRDRARVKKWLGDQDYVLKDGLSEEWERLLPRTNGE
ncbi:uroporphyrin-III C-methyltransferase [Naganishia albida]|nr:uroporphyrin-III C-methyltransferase [Naganishia albida]